MNESVTLTIMPGTTILISAGSDDQEMGNALSGNWQPDTMGSLYTEDYAKTHIEIVGRIVAMGEPDRLIRFTSNSPTPTYADWSEIRLYPGSKIDYSVVEYSGRAGIAWQSHTDVQDANITISNSVIQHVFWGGIVAGPGSWDIIANNISDCGSEGIAIEPVAGEPYIAENTITNSTVGIATIQGSSATIDNNTLTDNIKGILSRGNDIITNNTISCPSQTIHEQSYSGYTFPYMVEPPIILFTGILIAENATTTIDFNNISDNQRGIAIGPNSLPTLTVRNNNFYKNAFNLWSDAYGVTIDAPNNWWGTVDSSEIANSIHDYYDDSNVGMVNFQPIAYIPIESAGIKK